MRTSERARKAEIAELARTRRTAHTILSRHWGKLADVAWDRETWRLLVRPRGEEHRELLEQCLPRVLFGVEVLLVSSTTVLPSSSARIAPLSCSVCGAVYERRNGSGGADLADGEGYRRYCSHDCADRDLDRRAMARKVRG